MFTLGYRFRPWRSDRALADGPSILAYVRDTAREYGVDRHIRYRHRVTAADWDSAHRTLDRHRGDARRPGHADRRLPVGLQRLLRLRRAATGPSFPGIEQYAGTVVHPQHWPEDLDTTGRPGGRDRQRCDRHDAGARARRRRGRAGDDAAALADVRPGAAGVDPVARVLRRWLPERRRTGSTRWKNIAVATASLPGQPALAALRPRSADPERRRPSSCPRATRSTSTSSRRTTRGTSGCAWSPTATCSAPSARAASTSSPTPSTPSPRRASGVSSGERAGRRRGRHRDRLQPQAHGRRRRCRSTASRSTSASGWPTGP